MTQTTVDDCYTGCSTIVTEPVDVETTTTTVASTTSTTDAPGGGFAMTGGNPFGLLVLAVIIIALGWGILRLVKSKGRGNPLA